MILLTLAALVTAAGGAPDCQDPQTQTDINICAVEEFKAADLELNQQWADTSAIMRAADKLVDADSSDRRPGYFATLLEAQRAWLKFRDSQCRAEGYAMRGGSGEAMLVGFCRTSLTRARTDQLKEMAADYNH